MELYIKYKNLGFVNFKSPKWFQEPKLNLEHFSLLLRCLFILQGFLGSIKGKALLLATTVWAFLTSWKQAAQYTDEKEMATFIYVSLLGMRVFKTRILKNSPKRLTGICKGYTI